jgi:flavin reductase (DIM6/NTAB) family NADH-FMN oxidoreductase RutF
VEKLILKPMPLLFPVPAVMVSCKGTNGESNIITIAWTGVVCSEPPTIAISVRRERYSYDLIKEGGDFVVNIPTKYQVYETDYCGYVSGRDTDKFKGLKLTQAKAKFVNSPLIAQCPINIECKVTRIVPLGSHDMFIGQVLGVNVDSSKVVDNKLNINPKDYFSFVRGEYRGIGEVLQIQGHHKR